MVTVAEDASGEEVLGCCSRRVAWGGSGIFHRRSCGMRLAVSDQQPMRNLRGFYHGSYRIGVRSGQWLGHGVAAIR